MAKQGQHKGARSHRSKSPNERGPKGEQVRGTPPVAVLPGDQHPERYRRDLNPDPLAGQNHGGHATGEMEPSAYDVKDMHRLWNGLSDADLKQLPVLPEGTRLEQGGAYFDLNDPNRGEFKAMGNMEAGPEHRFVAKSAVPYPLWNALIGVETPERLNVTDER